MVLLSRLLLVWHCASWSKASKIEEVIHRRDRHTKQNTTMPKINLAQETMRNQAIARRRKVIYLFSVIILVIVGGLYLGIVLLTKNSESKVAEVNTRINSLDQELKSREVSAKQIKAFSVRLVNVESLLKNHTRWSTALGEIERLVLPTVNVLGLSGGTESREISMEVQAPNIETAADLVVSLENETKKNETFFSRVTASSLSMKSSNESGVSVSNANSLFSTKLKFVIKPEGLLDKNISTSSEASVSDISLTDSPVEVTPVNPLIP